MFDAFGGIDMERLRNLRVLSKLEVGDRLCTRQHPFTIMHESRWPFSAAYRWANGESRLQTIDAIMALVSSCIASGSNSEVKAELTRASKGVASLAETYRDDKTATSALEIVLDLIRRYCGNETQTEEDAGLD
jgi:hypothetical protein